MRSLYRNQLNTPEKLLSMLAIVTVVTIDSLTGAAAKRLRTRSRIQVTKSIPCQKRGAQRG